MKQETEYLSDSRLAQTEMLRTSMLQVQAFGSSYFAVLKIVGDFPVPLHEYLN
jgi:hypothetical protein